MTVPLRRARPYVFWGQTTSLCETCLGLVPTKIAIKGNEVWYEKRCERHGVQSTLVSTDAAYWRLCKDYIKRLVAGLDVVLAAVQGLHQARRQAAVAAEPYRVRLPL